MEWRVIPSFPDYEVSEDGIVRRLTPAKGAVAGRVLRSYLRPDGYRQYILRKSETSYHPRAHQLVADAFLGPKPFPGAEVCHNDGSRDKDHWSNLRWDTRSANHLDKRLHGTDNGGEKHFWAKLTTDNVREIRGRYQLGETQKSLATEFGVRQGHVSRIVRGERWMCG